MCFTKIHVITTTICVNVKVRLIYCQVETFLSQTSGFGEAVVTTCSMDTSELHRHHHNWDIKKKLSTINFRFAQNLILNLLRTWFFRFAQNFIDIREREAKEKATGSQRSGRWDWFPPPSRPVAKPNFSFSSSHFSLSGSGRWARDWVLPPYSGKHYW